MIIRILEKSYLVLYTMEGKEGGLKQHICRDVEEQSDREYRAVQLPAGRVTGELIQYLMEQVNNKSFREFVDYVTDAEYLTVFMDCGWGNHLTEILLRERLSLGERLEIARRLLEHLVLSDFPPYFVCAAMGAERVKITAAMDFGFDFELADLADFKKADFSMACGHIADTLSTLFEQELKRRAFPDMESFLYRLRHEEFADLLSIYQELLGICRIWKDKDEARLESKRFAFVLWERIKGLGRFLKVVVKLAVVLLAAGYLAYSIYQFVQPDPVREVYQRIGELEIRTQPEAEKK